MDSVIGLQRIGSIAQAVCGKYVVKDDGCKYLPWHPEVLPRMNDVFTRNGAKVKMMQTYTFAEVLPESGARGPIVYLSHAFQWLEVGGQRRIAFIPDEAKLLTSFVHAKTAIPDASIQGLARALAMAVAYPELESLYDAFTTYFVVIAGKAIGTNYNMDLFAGLDVSDTALEAAQFFGNKFLARGECPTRDDLLQYKYGGTIIVPDQEVAVDLTKPVPKRPALRTEAEDPLGKPIVWGDEPEVVHPREVFKHPGSKLEHNPKTSVVSKSLAKPKMSLFEEDDAHREKAERQAAQKILRSLVDSKQSADAKKQKRGRKELTEPLTTVPVATAVVPPAKQPNAQLAQVIQKKYRGIVLPFDRKGHGAKIPGLPEGAWWEKWGQEFAGSFVEYSQAIDAYRARNKKNPVELARINAAEASYIPWLVAKDEQVRAKLDAEAIAHAEDVSHPLDRAFEFFAARGVPSFWKPFEHFKREEGEMLAALVHGAMTSTLKRDGPKEHKRKVNLVRHLRDLFPAQKKKEKDESGKYITVSAKALSKSQTELLELLGEVLENQYWLSGTPWTSSGEVMVNYDMQSVVGELSFPKAVVKLLNKMLPYEFE